MGKQQMKKVEELLHVGERVVIVGASFIAIVLLVAERIPGFSGMFRENIPSFTLFLLSVFVLSFFARERMLTEVAQWRALGLRAVYHNRNDAGQFPVYIDLLNSVQNDLLVVGITLHDVRSQTPLFIEKGRQACYIKLLLMNPRYWKNADPILDPVAAAMGNTLKADFQQALSHIRSLALSMANVQAKLEVRFYHQAPTLSLTVADGDSAAGKMRVELTPHNSSRHGYFRPMLDLQRVGEKDLFSHFYQHYRDLWDNAPTYIRVQDSKVWIDPELDEEISRMLDLPVDWLPQELRATKELNP